MIYRGFNIQKQSWSINYNEESIEIENYLVFIEFEGEKYVLSGQTAFDTEEEAKAVIDKMYEEEN